MAWLRDQPVLVRSFRQGERPALAAIYRHYLEKVLALIRSGFLLPGPPPARIPGEREPSAQLDFAQDVFLRAFSERARLSYDGLRPYGPYLLRIARNLRIDQHRKRSREVSSEDLPETANADARDEAEELHWRTLSEATSAYLETLDEEARTFVHLRFEEELSQSEVGERMGSGRRRVRTLEKRITSGLRKHLQKEGLR